jgi:galactose-1-phosphate uridylyltransferase
MRRTVARLADGREIIYFDEHDSAERAAVDTRELPALETSSEIRYDVVLGEWVAIASHRQWRTHLPPADGCPLCPSTAERPTEIPSGEYAVVVFENRGEEIGVTIPHPHGQIFAYPFVTPRTRRMLESARRHRDGTGRNLFADVLDAERRAAIRVVASGEHWTAFVPAAARWPIEVHLYPTATCPTSRR